MRGIGLKGAGMIPIAMQGGGQGAASTELNLICPAITPTIGAEMWDAAAAVFTAGTYAWTVYGTNTIANDANRLRITYVDNGSGAKDNLNNAADLNADLTLNTWYQYQVDASINAGSAEPTVNDGTATHYIDSVTSAIPATYTHILRARHATAGFAAARSMGAGEILYFDNLSLKPVTDTDLLLGSHAQTGTYVCTPTVADNSACGFKVCYLDATHFIWAAIYRRANGASDQAQLFKCTSAAAWGSVISGNLVYGAGQELKVIVNAATTNVELWYNGAQIGVTTAVAELATMGTGVYGFNNLAGNTVGTVTTTTP